MVKVAFNSPFGCWGDLDDPYYGGRYYSEMLKVAYPTIITADPNAQVMVGGLLLECDPVNPPEVTSGSGELKDCTSDKFLEGILENDGGEYFDGVSVHAYDFYFAELGKFANSN